jgi:hypothetical protein
MTAFVIAELREWREQRMRREAVAAVLALGAVGALSLLQPIFVALAATAVFLFWGWAEGNRYQSTVSARRILLEFPAPTAEIAAGKAIACVVTWAFTLLVASPLLALAAIAWGISPTAALACVLCWFVSYYATASAGFVSSLLFAKSDGLPGLFFVVIWLAFPLVFPAAAVSSPFFQAWSILKATGGSRPFLGMGAIFLAASAALGASSLVLSRIRRKSNG